MRGVDCSSVIFLRTRERRDWRSPDIEARMDDTFPPAWASVTYCGGYIVTVYSRMSSPRERKNLILCSIHSVGRGWKFHLQVCLLSKPNTHLYIQLSNYQGTTLQRPHPRKPQPRCAWKSCKDTPSAGVSAERSSSAVIFKWFTTRCRKYQFDSQKMSGYWPKHEEVLLEICGDDWDYHGIWMTGCINEQE